MKKYIRFQTVNAEPCTRMAYKTMTGRDPIADKNDSKDYPGYTMVSSSGFQKWMKAETFDNIFAPYNDWKERLQFELAETAERINKLSETLALKKEKDITDEQMNLMQTQLMAMQTYANIMAMRLDKK